MTHVLVTGGAGFIGSHIVEKLIQQSCRVTVLDNLSSGSKANLPTRSPNLTLIEGDIRDSQIVRKLASEVDAVVHLAAIVSNEACNRQPDLAFAVNTEATRSLLEAARAAGLDCFVYASSAAVYGDTARLPISEDTPTSPISTYGVSKLRAEQYCLQFQEDPGIRVVCLRFFNVFGPRQTATQYSGVITQFMEKLKHDEPPVIFGSGLQTRDFVHANDVAESAMSALKSGSARGAFNIATGRETSISELADLMIRNSGQERIRPIHAPERAYEIKRSVGDIRKAEKELDYSPKTNMAEDLRRLWTFYSTR